MTLFASEKPRRARSARIRRGSRRARGLPLDGRAPPRTGSSGVAVTDPAKRARRRFIDAPDASRCAATVYLRDGSGAQCGRNRRPPSALCTQHERIRQNASLRAEPSRAEPASSAAAGTERALLPCMTKTPNVEQGKLIALAIEIARVRLALPRGASVESIACAMLQTRTPYAPFVRVVAAPLPLAPIMGDVIAEREAEETRRADYLARKAEGLS